MAIVKHVTLKLMALSKVNAPMMPKPTAPMAVAYVYMDESPVLRMLMGQVCMRITSRCVRCCVCVEYTQVLCMLGGVVYAIYTHTRVRCGVCQISCQNRGLASP